MPAVFILKAEAGWRPVALDIGFYYFIILTLVATSVTKKQRGRILGMSQGKKKVLFMDDEQIVREVARHMLQSLGYDVELAESGEEAVKKYLDAYRSSTPYDAVILDLTIRDGMSGTDALGKIRDADPAVNAILSSGYSDDPAAEQYRDMGFRAKLTKPYNIQSLKQVLSSTIGSA